MTADKTPAIVIFNAGRQALAERVKQALPNSMIYAFRGCGSSLNQAFTDSAALFSQLFQQGRPMIALTATGIIIRLIAPFLSDKRSDPPVLALTPDGKSLIPLLGGANGADDLASSLAQSLKAKAIISSLSPHELGLWLAHPPQGWHLDEPDLAKGVTRRLLEGEKLIIHGEAPWLEDYRATEGESGPSIWSDPRYPEQKHDLHFIPSRLALWVSDEYRLSQATERLRQKALHPRAIALLACPDDLPLPSSLRPAYQVRASQIKFLRRARAWGWTPVIEEDSLSLFMADHTINHHNQRLDTPDLAVIGLGAGAPEWLTPEACELLRSADIWIGYETYLRQAESLLASRGLVTKARQKASGNRVELDRARDALCKAQNGQSVAVISSGDPGIFAMSAAILEAYEALPANQRTLDLRFVPGISAFQAAAARLGAPFGHDFALLSLSDNLKPWSIIERRLKALLETDMIIGLYNPASMSRQEPVLRLASLLKSLVSEPRTVWLARNIGREGESLTSMTTADFAPEQVDMNTLILIGSSQTHSFTDAHLRPFSLSPRSWPESDL